MSPKRGDRAAPPPRPGEYEPRFANNAAAKGWEDLRSQVPENTRAAYDAISANPRPTPPTDRHHRLKGSLKWGNHGGRALEQWQYEVTSAGRIWYLVDEESLTVWLTFAGTGHPKITD
ncbi:hypothetical protein [Longispora albida]|uniref:hypothetical protein n=1 Tax=Longispora albida TaxID=203523 RepID=UPI000362543F|nr:hypothetical protein [Longispora albida]